MRQGEKSFPSLYGAASGFKSGVITSTAKDFSYPDGKTVVHNVIVVSYIGQTGDSGAPAWRSDSKKGDSPLGLHIGITKDGKSAGIVPLVRILNQTGMTLYDF